MTAEIGFLRWGPVVIHEGSCDPVMGLSPPTSPPHSGGRTQEIFFGIHNPDAYQEQKSPAIRRTDPVAQNNLRWGACRAIGLEGREVSYGQLDFNADVIAGYLAAHLDASRQMVGLFFGQNRPEFFEVSLAAKRIGASYTSFHSHLTPEEFLLHIQKQPYRVIFVDRKTRIMLEPFFPQLKASGKIIIDIDGSFVDEHSYAKILSWGVRPRAATPDDFIPQYRGPIMQSSGTTGQAKIVPVDGPLSNGARANRFFRVTDEDRHLVVGQLYHGGASSWARGHLNRGASIYLMDMESLVFDPQVVLESVAKYRITNFWISAPWLHSLCLCLDGMGQPSYDLSSLRAIFVGAATCYPFLREMADRFFGPVFWDNYATTELGLIAALAPPDFLPQACTVGCPAPGVNIEIRNREGEILKPPYIGEVFVQSPLSGGRFEPSGDVGFMQEGYLSLVGRSHEMPRDLRNLYFPRQIEDQVFRMPGVRDCCVVRVSTNHGEEELVVAVERKPDTNIHENDILANLHVKGQRPQRVVFFESLPRIPYKVNIPELRERVRHQLEN